MSAEQNATRAPYAEHRAAYAIAARVNCDHRTAARALAHGVDSIRHRRLREELRAEIARLNESRLAG